MVSKKLITALTGIGLLLCGCSERVPELQKKISILTKDFPGEIGVAVACGKDTVCINADGPFPMFSVVKFPQAVTVAERVNFDEMIDVTAEDLKPDTWSPMREKYPEGGSFSVRQIVEYALIESDNNASDILFDRFDTPEKVEQSMVRWKIGDCCIECTEAEMHDNINLYRHNWMTPMAAVNLLGEFLVRREESREFEIVWETMTRCNTGAERIPKYISDKGCEIIHKTGTGPVLEDGTVTGINDIACVLFPDDRHFELAVFIKNAKCEVSECEELIAKIAETVYFDKRDSAK